MKYLKSIETNEIYKTDGKFLADEEGYYVAVLHGVTNNNLFTITENDLCDFVEISENDIK